MNSFRSLRADEVEARISTVSASGLSLLLYKDARCDMRVLDETVGPENWQREHYECKGNLFCRVGIRCGDEWVWKSDCGAESYTEKEKGEASDSFKRACFNWGLGRELYTAPFIWIPATASDGTPNYKAETDRSGKPSTRTKFRVAHMTVEDGKITALQIDAVNPTKVVFAFGRQATGKNCEICGKLVGSDFAQKSMAANGGHVYCSGTCKKRAAG